MTQVSPEEVVEDVGGTRTADVEIRNNLLAYGEDVLLTKIPHYADGCKAIVRRILWFNRDNLNLRPMNKMVGDLQDVHTGGDASIADAILRLGQDFNVGHPLVEISGKSGEYYNQDAAAATRYLDASLSEFASNVFFKNVNVRSLQMVPTKNNNNTEPRYLIPKIPMALVLGNLTVGMAFKSQIPMIDLAQVCALVSLYAKYYSAGHIGIPPAKTTAKYLLPGFPIKNIILNRKELLAGYAQGNYTIPIQLEGWIDIAGNSITLRTLPYGNNFGRVVNRFRDILRDTKNSKSKFKDTIDSANNYSSDETEFTINLKSGKNPFAVLDSLRSVLVIDDSFHPIYNYVRNERVVNLDPPTLIYMWYQDRIANIISGLNHRQAALNAELMETHAILLVIDHSDEVIAICRNAVDDAEVVETLYHRFTDVKLTRKQADIIRRQPLSVFNRSAKAKLLAKQDQLKIDLERVRSEFSSIHETINNEAIYLQKRYGDSTKTLSSDDFIGHVQFGNWGLVNFFNFDEMKNILSSRGWPSTMTKTVMLYDSKRPRKQIIKDGKVIELQTVTKEITCERMVCYPTSVREEMTLVISNQGTVSVVERLIAAVKEGYTLCPISKRFYAIHRDGNITVEDYNNHSIRKSVASGRKSTIIYGLPESTKDVLIFHMNPADPNNLRVSRILYDAETQHKIKFAVGGATKILGVYPIGDKDIVLNVPKECVKGIRLTHLFIHSAKNLFTATKDDYHIINLTRGKNDVGVRLKQDTVVNSLFHLDLAKLEAEE